MSFVRVFLDEPELADGMVSEQGKRKDLGQDSENFERSFRSHDENEDLIGEGISVTPRMYGPDS